MISCFDKSVFDRLNWGRKSYASPSSTFDDKIRVTAIIGFSLKISHAFAKSSNIFVVWKNEQCSE